MNEERSACGGLLTRRQAIGVAAASASVAISGCTQPAPTDDPPSPDAGRAEAAIGEIRTFRILATSDLHGKMLPWNYPADTEDAAGSMAQLASAIAEFRDEHTLLVDVGDTIQDNMADLFLEDEVHPMIACLNRLRYDIGVTGNHEYNYGMDVVRRTVASFEGTVLTGNVIDEHGEAIAEGYAIIEIDGIRIGIIGMVTPNILRWDAFNLEGCTVTDPAAEARAIIDRIRDEVDVLVAAVHMKIESEFDMPGSGVEDFVERCPEFDVVLAAHGHTLIEGEQMGNALVVENKFQAQTMAVVEVACEFTDSGWKVAEKSSHSVDISAYAPDPAMVEFLEPYDERAKSYAREVVGRLEGGPLAPEDEMPGIPAPLLQDTALVDLINAAQLHYSGADVAASELCSIGANIEPGDIRRCDVTKIYKYTNTLYTLRMTGAQLRAYLEYAASLFKQWHPGDVTLAFTESAIVYNVVMLYGVSYLIDVSKEAGSRITALSWPDGTPVSDDDTFALAIDNYRASSQLLGYGTVFAEGDELPEILEADIRGDIGGVRELIADYIENVRGGIITPDVDRNWSLTGNDWDPALHARAVELARDGAIETGASDDQRLGLCTIAITEGDLAELST